MENHTVANMPMMKRAMTPKSKPSKTVPFKPGEAAAVCAAAATPLVISFIGFYPPNKNYSVLNLYTMVL
jgi:hypothetical protein